MFGLLFNMVYDEARKIWCYRRILLATSSAILVAATAVIFALPDTYSTSGQIYVNKETPLTAATEGVSLVGEGYGSPYVIQKTLLNDQNLRKVVLRASQNPKAMTEQEINAAIGRVRGGASIKAEGEDGFIEFAYKDSDPVRAQRTTKALIDQFIIENVNRSSRDLQQASNFLDQQIGSYEKQLADNQAKMDAFRRAHPRVAIMTPLAPVAVGGGGGAAEVAGARAELAAILGRTQRPGAATAPQDGAIAQAEGRLAGLLTQYTEQHPDVISTRREITALRAQRTQYLASAPAQAAPADPAVAAARARLAAAQARARASGGAAPIDAAPDLSAQWAELRRTHEVIAENYQRLIQRREGARMSQAVFGSADSGKYQITREPTVPGAPSGPDRGLFFAAAAFVALAAGVAAAYLRAAVAGIFVSPRELEDAFQLPVIGTVSWEPAWHVKKSNRSTPALPAR